MQNMTNPNHPNPCFLVRQVEDPPVAQRGQQYQNNSYSKKLSFILMISAKPMPKKFSRPRPSPRLSKTVKTWSKPVRTGSKPVKTIPKPVKTRPLFDKKSQKYSKIFKNPAPIWI